MNQKTDEYDIKLDKILDILSKKKSLITKIIEFSEKLFIPIFLGILAYVTSQAGNKISEAQNEIARSQLRLAKAQNTENLQAKYIELFYQEIASQDVQKQRYALSFLKVIELDAASPLLDWAENNVEPGAKPQVNAARKDVISRLRLQELNKYKVQIFFNENRAEQKEISLEIQNALRNAGVRSIIEVKPQLDRASSDQIRYFPENETEVAKTLQDILNNIYTRRKFNLQKVNTPSPGSVSIFLKTES